jgi:hypothetical protein
MEIENRQAREIGVQARGFGVGDNLPILFAESNTTISAALSALLLETFNEPIGSQYFLTRLLKAGICNLYLAILIPKIGLLGVHDRTNTSDPTSPRSAVSWFTKQTTVA